MGTRSPLVPKAAIAKCFPAGWRPADDYYVYSAHPKFQTFLVPVSTIEPPSAYVDFSVLDTDRLIALARRIAANDPLPPIGVSAPPISPLYLLRIGEGFHRYYLCCELGFTQIPCYFIDDSYQA